MYNDIYINFQWHVGDLCQAVFSEDGLIYNAEIIEMFDHNNTCVVRYMDYGNEEEQYLTDLLPFTDKPLDKNHVNAEQNVGSAPIQVCIVTCCGNIWS